MEATLPINLPAKLVPIFTERARYKAAYGGRSTAKSHSFATALLGLMADMPIRVLCCREVQKTIKDSVYQLLVDKITDTPNMKYYFPDELILKDTIKSTSGGAFIFSGLSNVTADQLKSMERIDIAWVEEAQTISGPSMEILIPTIRGSKLLPKSELWFSWNPRNAEDPVDQLFRGEHPPEDAIIIRMDPEDNPFNPQEMIDEMERSRRNDPHRFGHIWRGEYEPMVLGAIWDRNNLRENRKRTKDLPKMIRILVCVDPAIGLPEDNADEHGIIVIGLGQDGRGYVLEDCSMRGRPDQWAARVAQAFDEWSADNIVIEINQGGAMCKHTIMTARQSLGSKVIQVRAKKGKHIRAAPVAALYGKGQISHAGTFKVLEDQMCQMTAEGYQGIGSPDHVDALVWGFTEMFPQIIRQKPEKKKAPGGRPKEGGWMG